MLVLLVAAAKMLGVIADASIVDRPCLFCSNYQRLLLLKWIFCKPICLEISALLRYPWVRPQTEINTPFKLLGILNTLHWGKAIDISFNLTH
jgi:hypothetical protein